METVQSFNSNADEHSDLGVDGNINADGSGPLSRSSVTHVAYIVSKFDEVKRGLVREIGFDGILDLPQISKIDRKFTLWLLTKLDVEKKCIIVNGNIVTDVVDFEVGRILGIPCGRKQVCPLEPADKKSKIDFIYHSIGAREMDTNGLVAAERNVTAHYFLPLSKQDVDSFKVSFVVWVMGHLLAPTKKHNIGSDRFWGALKVPDDIKHFNWAAYVLEELFMAAKDVQHIMKQKKPVTMITGCSILLQILYFDSLRMGALSRPHGIVPRVKAYDCKSLSILIAADKASCSSGTENPTWGTNVRTAPVDADDDSPIGSPKSKSATCNVNVAGNEVISDYGTFVRNKFGDKVSPAQAVALSWFHARCTQHVKNLRLRLQEDTTALVEKLFRSEDVSLSGIPRLPVSNKKLGVRQVQSEPLRTLSFGRTIQNSKRSAEGSVGCPKYRRGPKRAYVSGRKYELPETILTGMDVSGDPAVDDQISDSEYHSKGDSEYHSKGALQNNANQLLSSGWDIGVPSFDLGIDFDTPTQKPKDGPPKVHGKVLDMEAFADSSVGSQSPDACGEQNISIGLNIIPTESIRSLETSAFDVSHTDIVFPAPPSLKEDLSLSVTGNVNEIVWRASAKPYDGLTTPIRLFNLLGSTPPSGKCLDAHLFVSPDERIKSSTTSPGSLAKILAEGDLVERITRTEDSPNMNIPPWESDYINSPIKKRSVRNVILAESPWSCHMSHRNPPRDIVDKFFDDVSGLTSGSLTCTWVSHKSPRQIEVEGSWIHQVFIMQKPVSYDIFDLAIRRLKQLDDMMYATASVQRWRHVLDSELAMLALAGECPYNRKPIVEQFTGSCVTYSVENCRMIVVPAYILMNWSCYFFDFKDKCVHVVDPLFNKAKSKLFMQMHEPNVNKVAVAVANCIENFFENWNVSMDEWDVKFVQPTVQDATSAETGLLTLLYVREFDGSKIHNATRDSFLEFKKLMLYELMCLKENYQKAPVNLTISIDD